MTLFGMYNVWLERMGNLYMSCSRSAHGVAFATRGERSIIPVTHGALSNGGGPPTGRFGLVLTFLAVSARPGL